jgi:hypothetical protein
MLMMMPKLQNGYNAIAMIICARKRKALLARLKEGGRKDGQTDQDAFPAAELTLHINKKSQPFWSIVSRQWTL